MMKFENVMPLISMAAARLGHFLDPAVVRTCAARSFIMRMQCDLVERAMMPAAC
jgi:hypothetical protein